MTNEDESFLKYYRWFDKLSTQCGCEISSLVDCKDVHNFDDPVKKSIEFARTMKQRIQDADFVVAILDTDRTHEPEITIATELYKDCFLYMPNTTPSKLSFYPYLLPYNIVYCNNDFVSSFQHFVQGLNTIETNIDHEDEEEI